MINVIKILSIILLLTIGSGGATASQSPGPKSFKSSDPPQTHTKEYQQQPKPYPSSTYASKSNMDTQETKDKGSDEGSTEWLMAVFTLALVIVGFIQAYAMIKQRQDLHESIELTREEIEIAKEAGRLAREEFIANHPSKLRVHSVILNTPGFDEYWSIQCSIDNVGESAAIIKSSNMTFKKIVTTLPAKLPFSHENHALPEKTIPGGEGIIGRLIVGDIDKESFGTDAYSGFLAYYFFGYIDYTDSIGTTKRTAFLRAYDPTSNRFTTVEDEDHEYSY